MSSDPAQISLGSGRHQADFLSLAETLSSLIALIQADELIYVNPAGCALLGYPTGGLVGRKFWEVVHPDDRETAAARGRRRQAGIPQDKRIVERLISADGRAIWMDYSVDVIQVDGRIATLVTGYDVTESRRVEAELRCSEARLAEAQQIAHIGSWEWDIARDKLVWSEELCRIFGARPEHFGATMAGYVAFVHPDDRTMVMAAQEEAVQQGRPFAFEHRIVRRDGTVRIISGRGEVFADASGTPVRLAGTGQDITERRQIEEELRQSDEQRRRADEALRDSEERFRNLCTQAPVMLMAFDPDGLVREVSNYWLQTMGYERAEIIGRDGLELITADSQVRLRDAIAANQHNQEVVIKNLPLRAIRKDGTLIDLMSTSVAEVSDSGETRGAICVQVNLSDLQRAEAALRESEERYRALVEHAPEAIMVLDVELDRFVDANAHAEKLFGYSRERLLSMGPLDFCSMTQADGRPSCEVVEDEQRKVLDGGTAVFEFTHVDASGREIACQTRLSRLPAAGRKLIRTTVTDISELKELQEKVRRAERLAAVGALAAGVAHEIGNPLMALSMAAQSLERRTCDDYTRTKLTLVREHVERISRIVRQMSDLARPRSVTRAGCDLNHVVRRAVEMVRHDKRAAGAVIHYELGAHLPVVQAVEDDLTQVCINLALNAFDAMATNGEDLARCLTIRSLATSGTVRVSFADTGPGIAREARAKLFEPFFTTKEAGRGSGLGLSVSYRIIEEHRGRLWFEEGAPGATFVFELPSGEPGGESL